MEEGGDRAGATGKENDTCESPKQTPLWIFRGAIRPALSGTHRGTLIRSSQWTRLGGVDC
jgi:hypothetical protein